MFAGADDDQGEDVVAPSDGKNDVDTEYAVIGIKPPVLLQQTDELAADLGLVQFIRSCEKIL